MTVQVYQLKQRGQEVHMMGNYVGVVFKIKPVIMQVGKFHAEVWEHKDAKPYIDFKWIRVDSDGEPYEDDDSPVRGGLTVDSARNISVELAMAINYINGREWED